MLQAKTTLIFILGAIFAIFVLQNTDVVEIRFLFWNVSMSRIILLPIIFGIGLISGYILGRKRWS